MATNAKRWFRLLSVLALSAALMPGQLKQRSKEPAVQEPPEEDESLKAKEYSFNPLQAAAEIKIGLYYQKKKSWKAAAKRFEEATKWDPGNAEAYLRLGETREKMNDATAAKEAYAKFIELAPESKLAPSVKKKIGSH